MISKEIMRVQLGGELGELNSPYAFMKRAHDNKSYKWDMVGMYGRGWFLKTLTLAAQFGGVLDNGYYYNYSCPYHTDSNNSLNSSNSYFQVWSSNVDAIYNRRWTTIIYFAELLISEMYDMQDI